MSQNNGVSLFVDIPVCSFRKGFAREYLETEEVPPPSTVYGFLLSLIGEEERFKYLETQIAYALLSDPERSVVLRTCWRVKDRKIPPGTGTNRRPDFQEILSGVQLAIWVKPDELASMIEAFGTDFSSIERFGGLSLGEIRDLVNDVKWFPNFSESKKGNWLVREPSGDLPLPIWVDHVGSKGTVYKQFRLVEDLLKTPSGDDHRWITISSPL